MTSGVPLLKSVRGSRWNFLAMCSRTRDMPGGIFPPPPVAGKRRKKTVAGTRVNLIFLITPNFWSRGAAGVNGGIYRWMGSW